jgi:multidrug efflux pump subunit AcrA (membrane-fusion protein)
MMKKWMFLLLLVGTLSLAGCGQAEMPEPVPADAESVVSQDVGRKVVVEATVEPLRWSELLFTGSGTVVEVLVEEGDEVAEGALLVQLDPTDAKLGIQEAEAALASAQAQLAQVRAGPRPEQIFEAQAHLSDVEAALSQAVARRDQLTAGAMEAEVAAAQAEVAAAEMEQRIALQQRDDAYEQKDEEVREQADYQLYAANEALAAAQVRLEAAQGTGYARLRAAQAGVTVASAERDVSQAQLDLLQAGVTPEEIAVGAAVVQQAEAALETARVALEHTEMRAPFAGTVTKINVDLGEVVAPGDVVVVLATLDQLQTRTVDLTELDVARVAEGQPAVVTVDALPGVQLRGHLARIGLRSGDYHGDVVYPITVALDEAAPELRWGMTAMVEIEVD